MNYGRFYRLFNQLSFRSADLKEDMVLKHTGGRTGSLRDMTPAEYSKLCESLERSVRDPQSVAREDLKRHRSTALNLMQKLGIDTTDWARINDFCRDRRIAGEEFRDLTVEDLQTLAAKLRGIQRNGGLRAYQAEPQKQTMQVVFVPDNGIVN